MTNRLYVHRTQALEALLQELWRLRPELKDKAAMTVYMGTAALLREVKLSAAAMNGAVVSSGQVGKPAVETLIGVKGVAMPSSMDLSCEPHPNEQWD
ncbi:MAG: hypothetical protein HLUCCA11_24475 [Phormidesmis priestleyi Ana]|uniref:Uncharacterized protein n=1 Tax=Phormidesmis priestleyi Ana TaxID=1666911 RepID=A0A0P7YL85_9CYAN|nr:MAG: hypothetical protein HLUCCA11_24475 [Phormidesmis priestleyi Ana]